MRSMLLSCYDSIASHMVRSDKKLRMQFKNGHHAIYFDILFFWKYDDIGNISDESVYSLSTENIAFIIYD